MKRSLSVLSLLALGLFIAAQAVQGQVLINTTGPVLSQDFNGMGTGNFQLVNNITPGFTGFYAARLLGDDPSGNIFFADNGTSATASFKNYGATGSADRAMGSLADASTDTMMYGVRFRNNTASTIASLEVTYTGEQWRDSGDALGHQLTFDYRTGALITGLTSGTYTPVPALHFTSPSVGNPGPVDGNSFFNRVTLNATFLVNLAPGQEVMIRWVDVNDAGADHGLAIDDLFVIARAQSTAGGTTITGRVTDANGRGISRTYVTLIGGPLGEPVLAQTNAFGYYSFDGIEAGHTYTVSISSKRYRFNNPVRTFTLDDAVSGLDFTAQD
jgi:hypothetical protein